MVHLERAPRAPQPLRTSRDSDADELIRSHCPIESNQQAPYISGILPAKTDATDKAAFKLGPFALQLRPASQSRRPPHRSATASHSHIFYYTNCMLSFVLDRLTQQQN